MVARPELLGREAVVPDIVLPSRAPSPLAALFVLRPRLVPPFAAAPADIELIITDSAAACPNAEAAQHSPKITVSTILMISPFMPRPLHSRNLLAPVAWAQDVVAPPAPLHPFPAPQFAPT